MDRRPWDVFLNQLLYTMMHIRLAHPLFVHVFVLPCRAAVYNIAQKAVKAKENATNLVCQAPFSESPDSCLSFPGAFHPIPARDECRYASKAAWKQAAENSLGYSLIHIQGTESGRPCIFF